MLLEPVLSNPWVRALMALAVLAALAMLAYLLHFVLVPLFFAFILAYIFDPVVDVFERRKVPRMVTIAGLLLAIALVILSIPVLLIPGIISEAAQLVEAAARSSNKQWLDDLLEPVVLHLGLSTEATASTPRLALAQYFAGLIEQNAAQFFQAHASQIATAGQAAGQSLLQILASIGNGLVGFVLFVGNGVLFLFILIYLLKDYDQIIESADALIPPKHRPRVRGILGKIDGQLRAFFRGQFTVCCCLAAMYAFGLTFAGVPFAVPIGILGGVASFVPYVGPVITVGPALLMALLGGATAHTYAGIIVTVVVAQALEGNVLTPKIVGSQVGLGPVWVILAIMVFGGALGFLGLLIAVPVAAVAKVLVLEAVDAYRRSAFFSGESAEDSGAGAS